MYSEADYWDATGKARIKEFMASKGIPEDQISEIIDKMTEIADEISWQAREQGRFDESFYHICTPDY